MTNWMPIWKCYTKLLQNLKIAILYFAKFWVHIHYYKENILDYSFQISSYKLLARFASKKRSTQPNCLFRNRITNNHSSSDQISKCYLDSWKYNATVKNIVYCPKQMKILYNEIALDRKIIQTLLWVNRRQYVDDPYFINETIYWQKNKIINKEPPITAQYERFQHFHETNNLAK